MDKLLFKLVESVWGRNLIYTLLFIFCAAIGWLSYKNDALNNRIQEVQAAATLQIIATERQCNKDKEDLKKELIEKYKSDNEKLEMLIAQFRELKRKR